MFIARVVSVTVLTLSLSACVVAPYAPAGSMAGGDTIADSDLAPPAPYVEVVPVAPYVGAIWLGGYWGWNAGRHVWIGGHWVRPRAGYYWSPYRWVPYGGRWHLHRGGWARH
jgi:hypothetical protein